GYEPPAGPGRRGRRPQGPPRPTTATPPPPAAPRGATGPRAASRRRPPGPAPSRPPRPGREGGRDGRAAVGHAERARELTGWKEGNFIDPLAAASAEAGDFDTAVEHQKQALTFPAFEKSAGPGARQRLDLYRQRQPHRAPGSARELVPPPRVGEAGSGLS